MARSIEEILATYRQLKDRRAPLVDKMLELRDVYNGDIDVPSVELDKLDKSIVANVIKLGLDQSAQRISSTRPDLFYAPLRPGIQRSENLSRQRRLANLAWWSMNRIDIKLRYRAHHLLGYGQTPVVIKPDFKREIPMWHLRSPINTFAAPQSNPDDITPDYAIFTYSQQFSWIRAHYPEASMRINRGPAPTDNDFFELIEYIDDTDIVLGLIGSDRYETPTVYGAPVSKGMAHIELERVPNRAGVCTVVTPGRVTLDRLQGQFDNVVPMFRYQNALMALEYWAAKKATFPNEWLEPLQAGQVPEIINIADGLNGEIGRVKNGRVNVETMNPSQVIGSMVDRIERNIRVTSGSPPEIGGESTSNIRTGKRGDSILSAVLDYPIQEAQEILADSLQEENRRAVAIVKGYWDRKQFSFYVPPSWSHDKQQSADYKPSDVFENDNNIVTFPAMGADANGMIIGLGQRVGIGTKSKKGVMMIDPWVEDPEWEHDQIVSESLEQAVLQSLQTQAAQGAITPIDIARISTLVRQNKMELEDAISQVNKEAQARQASSGPPGTPEAPAQPGTPDAQPGLAQPGAGGEAGQAIAPPNPSMHNLAFLLGDLGRGARTAKQEAAGG